MRAAIVLRELNRDNFRDILNLDIAASQKRGFPVSNAASIAQAYFHDDAWLRGIYLGDEPVGFLMLSVIPDKAEYFIWRMMIGQRFQRQGHGRAALEQLFDIARTWPDAEFIYVSHLYHNTAAGAFYRSLGFEYTGEEEHGDLLMRRSLKPNLSHHSSGMNRQHVLQLLDLSRRNPGKNWQIGKKVVRKPGGGPDDGFIVYTRCDEARADRLIAEQIGYFAGIGQGFEWKVYDHDQPADLCERLEKAGLRREPSEAFVVVDLRVLPERLCDDPSQRVIRVVDDAGLADYQRVRAEVFGGKSDHGVQRRYEADPASLSLFVGYDGQGKPVSHGRIDYDDPSGVFAGLFSGGTIASARCRGFYTDLVIARLREAAERDIRYVYVDALPTSEPILLNLGFERVTGSTPMIWRA